MFVLGFSFDGDLVACQIPLSTFSIFPNTIIAKLLVWHVFKHEEKNKYVSICLCFCFLLVYLFFIFYLFFCILFIQKKNKTLKKSQSHFEITLQETILTDLDFADDLALLTNFCEQMQLMTDSLKSLSKKVYIKISVDKTKIQKIGNLKNDGDIFLEGAPLEVVEYFTYLGSIQLNVGDIEKMSKEELEKHGQFSDGFKLFGDPK